MDIPVFKKKRGAKSLRKRPAEDDDDEDSTKKVRTKLNIEPRDSDDSDSGFDDSEDDEVAVVKVSRKGGSHVVRPTPGEEYSGTTVYSADRSEPIQNIGALDATRQSHMHGDAADGERRARPLFWIRYAQLQALARAANVDDVLSDVSWDELQRRIQAGATYTREESRLLQMSLRSTLSRWEEVADESPEISRQNSEVRLGPSVNAKIVSEIQAIRNVTAESVDSQLVQIRHLQQLVQLTRALRPEAAAALASEIDRQEKTLSAPEPRAKGPVQASSNVRMTTVTDFAPDVCKDYKRTGFCGFGDNCKFLHAREDYEQSWQLDQKWGRPETTNHDAAPKQDSGGKIPKDIPFKCILCEGSYRDPIVTKCGHYFCEMCAMKRYRRDPTCAACGVDTHGSFVVAKMQDLLP